MVVEVDIERGMVTVTGPDDFTRFHMSVRGEQDAARLDAVLRATATGACDEPSDATVRVDAVRRMAGRTNSKWKADFTAMLDFAGSKGWLTDDGGAIRAHVEWD
jgi:hypothetical protein